jgi:hypothetical protein
MNGYLNAASADEVVLQYERQLVAGDTKTAANIRTAHTDLTARFDTVDERLARK